ncbi:hypothetical protein Tco_1510110 [Tanacetum coccineum]
MGSNEEIIQLLQKTQTIFKQTQRDKEEKYLNDIIQLQDKIKDLENVLYRASELCDRASELCDKNEQLHEFDSKETLEDAKKSQLKMNEFQKDEKVQELKIQPIDYKKLNKLYKDFVPQKELSAEQTYFSSSSIPCVKDSGNKKYAEDIKEMKDAFDEIENQNDLLKDQLLEASLTADIKNLVITSCMEIRNKDLHDEIERISKESNDVSNESKTFHGMHLFLKP